MDLWAATAEGLVRLGKERKVILEGANVHALAHADGGLLALVDGHSLWRVEGDEARELAVHSDRRLNCVLAFDGEVLVGAGEARILRLTDSGLQPLSGFDRVESRDEWYTPWGGPPDVRSLARSSAGTLYANVHVGGVLRSDDGDTWVQTIDIDSDVHEVIAPSEAGSGTLLAATARGSAVSEDRGAGWTFATEGLHADYCRAVALAGRTLLMSASVGPSGGRAAIYRRALDQPTFSKCKRGLPDWFPENIDTGCLTAAGSHAFFGTAGGSVFGSSDAGESWEVWAEDLAPIQWILARD